MKPLLIFATRLEAQATLDVLKMTQVSEFLWQSEACDLLLCGIGSFAALVNLANVLQKGLYNKLYNLGCCADLHGRNWGEVYSVKRAVKALEQPSPIEHSRIFFDRTFPQIELDPLPFFASATLLTVDCPVHDVDTGTRLKADGDLVDMEGYALAWLAQQHQLPIHLIKCTSDFGNQEGPAAIRNSLQTIGERLADISQKLVNF